MQQVINKYKKIIVLEDDLLVGNDFLSYMNSALNEYKYNKSVMSISAYNHSSYKIFIDKNYAFDNFFSLRVSSWGWATWNDRWRLFSKKIPINEIKKNRKKIIKNLGLDVYLSLIRINVKKHNLWAANFCFAALKNNLFTSYPVRSRISNIGFDGSGQGGFSKKYKNNLKIKTKKKYYFNQNISSYGVNEYKFIKIFNQNFIIQFIKFYMPDKFKLFLKSLYKFFLKR